MSKVPCKSGLDCLKEEMRARGCTKSQCESKTVAIILDILSKSGDNHVCEYEMLADLEQIQLHIDELQGYYEKMLSRYKAEQEKQQKWRDEIESYVNNLLSKIEKCETAEGRDRMKTAQMYVNSVNVKTAYDNTAFIIGLAAILSGGEISAIDELQKINKKMPKIIRSDF